MTRPRLFVDLCCGTSSVSLWALGRLRPLTGFMGSKRSHASVLCQILGVLNHPGEVLLVDAGPWGDVWETLSDGRNRSEVVQVLESWHIKGTLPDVWPTLLYEPPADPIHRAAQYICLQSRAAGCIPIWWSEEHGRWESPSGSRTEDAHQRGGCDLTKRMKMGSLARKPGARKIGKLYRSAPSRGLVYIQTLADRVAVLDRIDWSRVNVIHGDVRDIAPVKDSIVYFDPPYVGCPRYAELLPRRDVVGVARKHAVVADLVVVSESEAIQELTTRSRWKPVQLPTDGKAEWLTINRPPAWRPAIQQGLFEAKP